MKNIASMLDFANHHANATYGDIQKMCQEVMLYQFNGLFVNPLYVSYSRQQLRSKAKVAIRGSEEQKVGTVIAFPLGQEIWTTCIASIEHAARAGALELDISLNVGAIKEAAWAQVLENMIESIACARSINPAIIIKFIPETGYLTSYEIQKVAELMVQAGADFFKTCSGMGPRGATVEDVQLIRAAVGHDIKIKVAGGITDYKTACIFIEAGVDRIGTSHAVEIAQGG